LPARRAEAVMPPEFGMARSAAASHSTRSPPILRSRPLRLFERSHMLGRWAVYRASPFSDTVQN
jgi:hypothetical protein